MSQLSSMFTVRDIIQTILGAFFLGHPVDKLYELDQVSYDSYVILVKVGTFG